MIKVVGLEKDKIKPIPEEIEEDSDLYIYKETETEDDTDILEELNIRVEDPKKMKEKKENIKKNNNQEDDKMPKKKVESVEKNIGFVCAGSNSRNTWLKSKAFSLHGRHIPSVSKSTKLPCLRIMARWK